MSDYPTEEQLDRIKSWTVDDARGWLDYIKSIWYAADWGWSEQSTPRLTKIYVSTAGWSGNEDIVVAMRENRWLWIQLWYSSRRGGHYEFRLE